MLKHGSCLIYWLRYTRLEKTAMWASSEMSRLVFSLSPIPFLLHISLSLVNNTVVMCCFFVRMERVKCLSGRTVKVTL